MPIAVRGRQFNLTSLIQHNQVPVRVRAGWGLPVAEIGLVLLETRWAVVGGWRPGVVGVMVDCRLVVVTVEMGKGGGADEM